MQSTGAIELNFIRMLRLLSFPSPQCAVARLDPLAESFARRVWTEAAWPPFFLPAPGGLGIKGPLCVNGGGCQGEFLGCTEETVKREGKTAGAVPRGRRPTKCPRFTWLRAGCRYSPGLLPLLLPL